MNVELRRFCQQNSTLWFNGPSRTTCIASALFAELPKAAKLFSHQFSIELSNLSQCIEAVRRWHCLQLTHGLFHARKLHDAVMKAVAVLLFARFSDRHHFRAETGLCYLDEVGRIRPWQQRGQAEAWR